MARILQIRRGTSAQNDNFTGMPGELSFDTDTKTVRVHDGKMLGGYTLARGDKNGAAIGTAFDINSVSDDFWAEKISQFTAAPITTITGRPVPAQKTSCIEYIFNTDLTPFYVNTVLVCTAPDAGYSVGEIVSAFGVGQYGATPPNTFRDASGLHVRMLMGGQDIWVRHRSTGAITNITTENWNILFRLYC